MNSGTVENRPRSETRDNCPAVAIDHSSMRSIRIGDSLEEASIRVVLSPVSELRGCRNREHSIGVSVKLTSSDTMMANAAV